MTTIVGGVYDEICHDPIIRRTYGSGVRAAAVTGDGVERLVTCADDESVALARSVLGGTRIDHEPRSRPITFVYDTPLSRPVLSAAEVDQQHRIDDIEATDALIFGMVEQNPRVRCRRAVIDPQHSMTVDQIRGLVTAEDMVVVANRREVLSLSSSSDVGVAAEEIRNALAATAVVVKCGALGALVATDGGLVGVPVVPTDTVTPIGSGDVFSAAFADAWFAGGGVHAAATAASLRTAGYCATRQLGLVDLSGAPQMVPTAESVADPPRIYVAASFANPEQRWAARTITAGIEDLGARAFSPLRDIGPMANQADTAAADLDGLKSCDAVIVLADSARSGPHFEAGWAAHLGLPVVVAASDKDPTRFTMLRGTGAQVTPDWSTAVYRAIWAGVEHQAARRAHS